MARILCLNKMRLAETRNPPEAVNASGGISVVTMGEHSILFAHDLIQHLAICADKRDVHRHLADGVRGAAQAGGAEPDAVLDTVEQALAQFLAVHIRELVSGLTGRGYA